MVLCKGTFKLCLKLWLSQPRCSHFIKVWELGSSTCTYDWPPADYVHHPQSMPLNAVEVPIPQHKAAAPSHTKGWIPGKPPQQSTKELPHRKFQIPWRSKSPPQHKAPPPHKVMNAWQPPSQLPLLPCTLPHLLIFIIFYLPQGHPAWPFTKMKKNAKGSCSAVAS